MIRIAIEIVSVLPDVHRARCPALPGCVASGRSRQEAAENMRTAVLTYLASLDAALPEKLDLEVVGSSSA